MEYGLTDINIRFIQRSKAIVLKISNEALEVAYHTNHLASKAAFMHNLRNVVYGCWFNYTPDWYDQSYTGVGYLGRATT